jgi:hypothetical protein
MARTVTKREMRLLGNPSKEETLALVGWLTLMNAFGDVVTDTRFTARELPPFALRWAGDLMTAAGRGHVQSSKAPRQQVVSNRKRKVKVRKGGLATGRH